MNKLERDIEKALEWKRIVLLYREGCNVGYFDPNDMKLPNIAGKMDRVAFELIRELVNKYGFDGRKGLVTQHYGFGTTKRRRGL